MDRVLLPVLVNIWAGVQFGMSCDFGVEQDCGDDDGNQRC